MATSQYNHTRLTSPKGSQLDKLKHTLTTWRGEIANKMTKKPDGNKSIHKTHNTNILGPKPNKLKHIHTHWGGDATNMTKKPDGNKSKQPHTIHKP